MITSEPRRGEYLRSAAAAAAVAEHLTALAAGAARAARGLPELTGWQGKAALAALADLHRGAENLSRVAAAFGAAAGAAGTHAAQLHSAAALLGTGSGPAGEVRAEALAQESARRCATTLATLADQAPARRSWGGRLLHRLDDVTTDVAAGFTESVTGLALFAVQAASTPISLHARDGALDPGDMADAAGVARHPVPALKALTDWDTWQQNPSRAVGHLLPDLLAAAASGGAATAARAQKLSTLTERAGAAAAARQEATLAGRRAAAAGARTRLVDRSLDEGFRAALAGVPPWRQGGARLDDLENAQAEAFHRLNAAGEPALTARMQEVARQADARLVGLESRLKSVDSLKRKIAGRRGDEIALRLARADDVVRYTLVLDGPAYTTGAHRAAALLTAAGLHLDRIWHAWDIARVPYRGINTFWVDPRTGVKVEVQFHTPASRRAAVETHPQYEEKRAPDTPRARRVELDTEMFAAYERVEFPPRVLSIEETTLIPAPLPDPFDPPPDHALALAVLAGAAMATASRS